MSTRVDETLAARPEGTSSTGIIAGWDEVPFSVGAQQRALMERHLALVIEKNKTMNLTRITDEREAFYLHVLDSLLLKPAFDEASAGPFVDIGTGAGFPGIPLAVTCGRKATLVDSVAKKAAAVAEFVSELGLGGQVRTVSERIERLGSAERGRYAVVTARAVAQTGVLVEYAAPLLRKGGRLVVTKGQPSDEEVSVALAAADICGMDFVSRETHELPHDLGHREILVFERTRNPRIKLPRAVGQAQHRPLGLAGAI